MVTALILPEIWTTELTQLKMWTVWWSSVFSILIDLLSSWFSCDTCLVTRQEKKKEERPTMIHLFPSSSSIFAGFFTGFVPGLGLRGGAFFALSGTTVVPAERSAGFLWVIWELSTFRNPEVTAPPRFKSAKRAAVPEAGGAEGAGAEPEGGGGGGGGGGADDVSGIDEGAGEPYGG